MTTHSKHTLDKNDTFTWHFKAEYKRDRRSQTIEVIQQKCHHVESLKMSGKVNQSDTYDISVLHWDTARYPIYW